MSDRPNAGTLATPECMAGPGKPGVFQQQARQVFAVVDGGYVDPWMWILNSCDSTHCLNPDHMVARVPTKIAYPPGVCVYCGMPAGARDHLVPRNKSGDARRITVAVVPSCGNCNSRINDFPSPNVTERRRVAQASIRRSARRILNVPPIDLSEYGPNLRSHLAARRNQREVVLMRLEWPEDPFYDIRAYQQSGFDDPVALGLCSTPTPTPAEPTAGVFRSREDQP